MYSQQQKFAGCDTFKKPILATQHSFTSVSGSFCNVQAVTVNLRLCSEAKR